MIASHLCIWNPKRGSMSRMPKGWGYSTPWVAVTGKNQADEYRRKNRARQQTQTSAKNPCTSRLWWARAIDACQSFAIGPSYPTMLQRLWQFLLLLLCPAEEAEEEAVPCGSSERDGRAKANRLTHLGCVWRHFDMFWRNSLPRHAEMNFRCWIFFILLLGEPLCGYLLRYHFMIFSSNLKHPKCSAQAGKILVSSPQSRGVISFISQSITWFIGVWCDPRDLTPIHLAYMSWHVYPL